MDDSEKKKYEIKQEVDAISESLGMDSWEKQAPVWKDECERYGICAKCCAFFWLKYEFSGDLAHCQEWDRQLLGNQRITECSRYAPRGQMTLNQMVDIATIIDISTKKVGFTEK